MRFLCLIDDYRFGFNGKEKDQNEEWGDLTHYDYGFRIYNPGIGRFLSVDPIKKAYETPYSGLSNNPISIIDPNGADTVFYNRAGEEIDRILAKGDHAYFLQHSGGNISRGGKSYFQGNSYYSFFQDNDSPDRPIPFEDIDYNTFSNRTIAELVGAMYTDEGWIGVAFNGGTRVWIEGILESDGRFDYKNSLLAGVSQADPTISTDNPRRVAYMVNGKLFNWNEAGNILFGGAMARTGISLENLSEVNNLLHHIEAVPGEELNEWNAMLLGYFTISGKPVLQNWEYKRVIERSTNNPIDDYDSWTNVRQKWIQSRGVDPTNPVGRHDGIMQVPKKNRQ